MDCEFEPLYRRIREKYGDPHGPIGSKEVYVDLILKDPHPCECGWKGRLWDGPSESDPCQDGMVIKCPLCGSPAKGNPEIREVRVMGGYE